MSDLRHEHFAAFFAAVHGAPPFAWQQRLLRDVATGRWPSTIAAPTGAGKTAVLDIALFHLAMEATRGAARAAPLRICFAVDRRIVVDQAYERGRAIACKLERSEDRVVMRVAQALKTLSRGDKPLHVEQLRGGMPREDDWARTPTQPTILCTTVDQLGSRLLFRGYGVSEKMAPVHAGLLGEDCLLILDEAHLSHAFSETLACVARWREERECSVLARPWRFSALTATPRGGSDGAVFKLTGDEQKEEGIRRRLEAVKRCALREIAADPEVDKHASVFADEALRLARTLRQDAVVAVVVNRVPLARAIFDALKREVGEGGALLLTGRVRPMERDALIRKHGARLFAGGERGEASAPLFVVATQCVEAGADFDFDALVTQIAPLDALRQRFGRLDRLGQKGPTSAVLIAAKHEVGAKADDAIYGDRARKTWEWLMAHAAREKGETPSIDFGPKGMQTLIQADSEAARACVAEALPAPILRGADLSFLAMTHPRPHPDPELSLFLHGELNRDTDVSIVWRADIEACFDGVADPQARLDRLSEVLAIAPPRSGEALRIPLWHARAWLKDERADAALADVDAPPGDNGAGDSERRVARRAREGTGTWELVEASQIRAGDALIAPSSYGGCDEFGWAPQDQRAVSDLAEAAAAPYEGWRAGLRLHPRLWPAGDVPWRAGAALITEHEASAANLVEALLELLNGAGEPYRQLHSRLLRFVAAKGLAIEYPYGEPEGDEGLPAGAVLWARRGLPDAKKDDERSEPITDDGDAGSFAGGMLELGVHRRDVESKARAFAEGAGLPQLIVNSLARAALLHDDGKGDPRFQAYLSGGALQDTPLAKSARRPRGEDRAARRDSGLPRNWRHEALSVRLACTALDAGGEDVIDPELVVWLVGTHHGYGRPFFPHDDGWDDHARPVLSAEGSVSELAAAPGPQRLDFEWRGKDWAQLFETLKRRYGVWGLAYLEAIVRLADHRASEERERGR